MSKEGSKALDEKAGASQPAGPAAPAGGHELEAVVHPLVLLSTVDHYNRVAKDTKKRAVGVLLGTRSRHTVDITNSFAVPFEEDLKNPSIWYLDHNFLESMFGMFKKVNAKERVVGFYSTGPKIKENDLQIAALFKYVLLAFHASCAQETNRLFYLQAILPRSFVCDC
jgi:26S proteasome regulatory subunit N8